MPLNLPVKEPVVIDPKATVSVALVVETAARYANEHDLCTVVNDALHDMGIDADVCDDDENELDAFATVTVTAIVRRNVDTSDFRDLTDEEVNEKMKGALHRMTSQPEFYYGLVESVEWKVTDVSLDRPSVVIDGIALPSGYTGGYGEGGSVIHLTHSGRTLPYSGYCGVYVEYPIQQRSGEKRICARCKTAAGIA